MTEKNYNPEQKAKKSMDAAARASKVEHKHEHVHGHSIENQNKTEKAVENSGETHPSVDKLKEEKKPVERPKKTVAMVNALDIPISTKHSVAICRFVKGKRIPLAISELEEVAKIRKAVPMRGEIPHRKGKMMSGRFPQKAAKEFIILLKSLHANANYNGIENPIVFEAKANIGVRPFGKHGIRRKRTHVTLAARTVGGKK